MVRLINSHAEGKLDKNEFADIVHTEDWIEEKLISALRNEKVSEVVSVEDAINRIGIESCSFTLMNLLISNLAATNGRKPPSDLVEMQIFTAAASYFFAKKTSVERPERAYISGLLSNISYFYMSAHHPEELEKITEKENTLIKRMTLEWEIFGIDHSEISYLILGNSRIPSVIYEPVRYHHQKALHSSAAEGIDKGLLLSTFFGSALTNIFYEDFSLTSEFRKDIKNLTGLYAEDLDETVEDIIVFFKEKCRGSGLEKLFFPGYFRIVSWFDTHMAMLGSEFDQTRKKITELNLQNRKYQKVLEDNSRKLVGIAMQDPLTGAFNRRYLNEKLQDEFLRAKRYGLGFTVISCDIDHFKKINDTYGHGYGDTVLEELVKIIRTAIRKTDYIARIGGEEFLIVCHSPGGSGGYVIAEKIRLAIENSVFEHNGETVPVTMSFGVADYYPEVKSAEELIRISDERLYTAKNAGRNLVVYK